MDQIAVTALAVVCLTQTLALLRCVSLALGRPESDGKGRSAPDGSTGNGEPLADSRLQEGFDNLMAYTERTARGWDE